MKLNLKRKLPPESLLYTGEGTNPTKISHIQYNEEKVIKHEKREDTKIGVVDWFVVEGLEDVKLIEKLCTDFNVDSLVIEDIFNVHQRNKIELYSSHIFSVQKYSYLEEDVIKYDYLSMLLFDDKLITFTERNNHFVNDIVKRLDNKDSIIRHQEHEYLFYVINDMMVDEKYSVYYNLEAKINVLENKLLSLGRNDELEMYNIRKELLFLRNTTSQLFDNLFLNKTIVMKLQDEDSEKYYTDLKDHLLNLKEKTIFEIDIINNLYEMHMNNLSHRMNSIMTTLTIFSAIFIPLSFIAGVFGMNFVNFPILNNDLGLLYFVLICLTLPVLMLLYFKQKKWF